MALPMNYTKYLNKKPILHTLFQKIDKKTLPNSLYEASTILRTKTKIMHKKKPIPVMSIDVIILSKILAKSRNM